MHLPNAKFPFSIELLFLFLKQKMWIGVMVYAVALNSVVAPPTLFSEYVALYDYDYDLFLLVRKGEELAHPGSTTKIATFLYALEQNIPRENLLSTPPSVLKSLVKTKKIAAQYAIDPYVLEPDAVLSGLIAGEDYSVEDLYHAMMLHSANDAANVVAYHLGHESIEAFMIGVNQLLKQIGCSSTTFLNPNGLEYPAHRTTAVDLVKMFAYGMRHHPSFLEILGKSHFELQTEKVRDRFLKTNNLLMHVGNKLFYKHCIGGKTGYTENAGFCLVTAAKNSERTLIAAILRAPNRNERFIDAINLFNAAFLEKKGVRTFYNKGESCFYFTPSNRTCSIPLALEEELVVETFESRLAVLQPRVVFLDVQVPIQKGQVCGYVEILTPNGKVIAKQALLATQNLGHNLITFFICYAFPLSLSLFGFFLGVVCIFLMRQIYKDSLRENGS